jgi:hypothetical protein
MNYTKEWKRIGAMHARGVAPITIFNAIDKILTSVIFRNLIPIDEVRGGISSDDILQICRIKLYELIMEISEDENKINFKAFVCTVIQNKMKDTLRAMECVASNDLNVLKKANYACYPDYIPFEEVYYELRQECNELVKDGGVILDTLFEYGAYGVAARLIELGIKTDNDKYFYGRIRSVKRLVKEHAYGKYYMARHET